MAEKAKNKSKRKKAQHPEMKDVEVISVDGQTRLIVKMCNYSKPVLQLQADPTTHPAYRVHGSTAKQEIRGSRAQQLSNRFAKLT